MAYHAPAPLLDVLLKFAHQQLEVHSGFYPFGAMMLPDETVSLTGISMDMQYPDTQLVIKKYDEIFVNEAARGDIVAAALCIDVKFTNPATLQQEDAIRVDIEHKLIGSISVFEPYEKKGDSYLYKDLFTNKKEIVWFLGKLNQV